MSFLASIPRTLGALVVGGMFLSSSASAAVLFQQLPDASLTGQQADAAVGLYGEALSLADPVVIDKITWWGYHGQGSGGSMSDNFEVWFDGQKRNGELTTVGDTGNPYDLIRYEWTLGGGGFSFGGGATTLGLINDSLDVEWFWQGSPVDPGPGQGPRRAFQLEGPSVPEPGSLWLIGLASAGLVLARRRSRIRDQV